MGKPKDITWTDWILSRCKYSDSGCLEYQGARKNGGYGRTWVNGVQTQSHRVIYQEYHGVLLKKDECVCHTCDNPSCVLIDHLFLGSRKENMDDKVRKKRHVFAEKCSYAKLTLQNVSDIRTSDEFISVLAKRYGVSESQISRIRNRKRWADR